MIAQHLQLVRRIARRLKARLPANVEIDDLVQAGLLALHLAAPRYDRSKGVPFEVFAAQRIRGAMIDEVRAMDPLSRGHRADVQAGDSALVEHVDLDDATTIADGYDAMDALQQLQERERIARAVRRLPPREQAIIQALYFEDLTQTEAADALGIRPLQVSRMRYQALARLRVLLTPSPKIRLQARGAAPVVRIGGERWGEALERLW